MSRFFATTAAGLPLLGRLPCALLGLLLTLLAGSTGLALEPGDIPADAPQDAVMAGPKEIREMQDWASTLFSRLAEGRAPAVRVELRRQDHSSLGYSQSCIDTPIKLGQRTFEHGLGTHANSEIVLHLPPDASAFKASVGIDNNFDTGGVRGSVQFSVEIAGKEVLRTPTLRGTNVPTPVQIALPTGTRELTLKVDATPDGPSHDQADWADACIITGNGNVCWADEDWEPFTRRAIPFSFQYDGAASPAFLSQWQHTNETSEAQSRFIHKASWTDPSTHLRVSATVSAFKRYPAVEWVLEFENLGAQDTPLLDHVQALDVQLRTGYIRTPVQLHHLVGDVCGERSFLPLETPIEPGKTVKLAPEGGRPSSGAFPFFNVQYGDAGLITAIGWSGQWQASLERSGAGPTTLRAGMENLSLRLRPGEKIRSPRILILPWKGDLLAAHNRFRRLMLFEYGPRQDGRPLRLPIALQCFDRYVGTRPDWGTEATQIAAARAASNAGCDMHWLDAAWFEGGFPNGVGNWYCPARQFPSGLKPISDTCHQLGLKFMAWFEPERVAPGTQVAREHPEFVFGGDKGGLFKLSDPAARTWLADLLSRRITEFGLDAYRNDFNIDPLSYWQQADAADRRGITEIRYVEGHYALWDDLLARHPGLFIDNCASGGRRIDLETCRRSVPLWHSDTGCSPGNADWNQSQICGLSLYVPLFGACAWTPGAYDLRSAATAGVICQFPVLDQGFSFEAARAALAEVRKNQKYWYGDFYPLTPCTPGASALIAWQLHRSDLRAGIVLAFRRKECPYPILEASLHGLNPQAFYLVDLFEEGCTNQVRTASGKDLMADFALPISKRGTSLLVRYKERSQTGLPPK
jgi:alpha-galactosidase